jgi:hypothetical protein
MKSRNYQRLNYESSEFLEFHFPLREWVKGTDLITDINDCISQRGRTFSQLLQWKQQGYLWPKPTLSSVDVFTFWVTPTLSDVIHHLPGLYGGSTINKMNNDSNSLQSTTQKKITPRPRLVLLDYPLDTPDITSRLHHYNLTSKRIWDYTADLIQYELIDVCKSNYVDLIVTTNDRLLTSGEEWLQYLLPHRTRLFIVPKELLQDLDKLALLINQRAFEKRKYKVTSRKKPLKNSYLKKEENE